MMNPFSTLEFQVEPSLQEMLGNRSILVFNYFSDYGIFVYT